MTSSRGVYYSSYSIRFCSSLIFLSFPSFSFLSFFTISRTSVKSDLQPERLSNLVEIYSRDVFISLISSSSVLPLLSLWCSFELAELAKITKYKNAYTSKTVLDRVISTKFLTHRVALKYNHASFQKIFVSPNMAAILNFRIFGKNYKTQKCLYLENWA